jgi:hypothetical protein
MLERFILEVEGPNLNDVQEIELPRPPAEGDLIETRFGTLAVSRYEAMPDESLYMGKVVCRLH